jgi:hypothetical protein
MKVAGCELGNQTPPRHPLSLPATERHARRGKETLISIKDLSVVVASGSTQVEVMWTARRLRSTKNWPTGHRRTRYRSEDQNGFSST